MVSQWVNAHATPAHRVMLEGETGSLDPVERAELVQVEHEYLDAYLQAKTGGGDG
jgi:hypothetical protein